MFHRTRDRSLSRTSGFSLIAFRTISATRGAHNIPQHRPFHYPVHYTRLGVDSCINYALFHPHLRCCCVRNRSTRAMCYRYPVSVTSCPFATCSLMLRNWINVAAHRGSARAQSLSGRTALVRPPAHEWLQHFITPPAFRDSASGIGKLPPSCARVNYAETHGFCRSEFVTCP